VIFHGTAAPAFAFELGGKLAEPLPVKRNAGNNRYSFAFAPLCLTGHPNDAVALYDGVSPITDALSNRLAATGTHPAVLGAVNQLPFAITFQNRTFPANQFLRKLIRYSKISY
jgi:hypothetical protein